MSTEPRGNRPIFIHTENGGYLKSNQITSLLTSFVVQVDPELEGIISLSLRASFATMMFRAHRAGEVFKEMTEEHFLEELGKMMNTSIEELRQTYIHSDSVDFHTTAREVATFLGQMGGYYNSEDEREVIEGSTSKRRRIPRFSVDHEDEDAV